MPLISGPERRLELLYACMLIHELQSEGLIAGGGMSVNADRCRASITVLRATASIKPPTRERAERTALGLMKLRGVSEEDEPLMRQLLADTQPELQFSE